MEWANKPSHAVPTVPVIEAYKETHYPDQDADRDRHWDLEDLLDDVDAEEDEEKDPGGPGQVQGVDIPLLQGTGHLHISTQPLKGQ